MLTNIKDKIQANLKTYTMIFALLIIWILFAALTNGVFLNARNLSNLFRQMTIVSFLAIGMVLVIVTGNIDLSVGSVCGFISAVVAYLQVHTLPDFLAQVSPEMSIEMRGTIVTIVAVLAGMLVGLIIGVYQGYLIAYLGIPAFIVTLGGQLIFRGGVLGVTQGKTIVPIEEYFKQIAQGYIPNKLAWLLGIIVIAAILFGVSRNRKLRAEHGFELKPFSQDMLRAGFFCVLVVVFVVLMNLYRGIPNPVLLMGVVALIFTYITTNTKFGRYTYALGGNKEATRLSGIDIKANVFYVFILMGLLAGVSGVVLTGYVGSGGTGGGINYELEAIASCVIGGTSLMGGEGTIVGALVGALIMASLTNGMSVMNMPIFWQYVIRGAVLILAVYIDVASKKSK